MAAVVEQVQSSALQGPMRPFNVQKDLRPVADLIELCFENTLDAEGRRYLQQMRSAAENPHFIRWALVAGEWASIPLQGYVWEQDGRLLGNLSLIPYFVRGRRRFLIANVCVHPEYRRLGIGRQLTLQGIQHARLRGAPCVWLQVREENLPAVRLYRDLGFIENARRTSWNSHQEVAASWLSPGLKIRRRRYADWAQHRIWLERTYPKSLAWHLPIHHDTFSPNPWGMFMALVKGIEYRHWVVYRNDVLIGVLSCEPARMDESMGWLAVDPQHEQEAAAALLIAMRRQLPPAQRVVVDYPAHFAEEAFYRAGFVPSQTLIWMSIQF